MTEAIRGLFHDVATKIARLQMHQPCAVPSGSPPSADLPIKYLYFHPKADSDQWDLPFKQRTCSVQRLLLPLELQYSALRGIDIAQGAPIICTRARAAIACSRGLVTRNQSDKQPSRVCRCWLSVSYIRRIEGLGACDSLGGTECAASPLIAAVPSQPSHRPAPVGQQ